MTNSLEFNKRDDFNKLKWSSIQQKINQIKLGGGESRIKKLHTQGKMTARERIDYLLDSNYESIEIGIFAGYDMYQEHGGCPAGGVVVKIGKISNQFCIIVANDATVKAGAWFPITGKKNLRAQEIAMENHLPIIYLVDSAGVYLPMQDEIFPDKEHFGRIFRNNAKMNELGIPQISAIMGSCVAGGAYLPAMSDEALIVENTGSMFLAGSYLVRAAIGEIIDNEALGGATTHSEISGVIDYKCKNDTECLDKIKYLISLIPLNEKNKFNKIESKKTAFPPEEIYGLIPINRSETYDIHKIIERIVDKDQWEEFKKDFGKTIVCGFGRIEGWAIGIIANQRELIKTKKGEMQFGGVIYSDSAIKAKEFIENCNTKQVPLLFIQDVTGFMVGSKAEHGGIITHGANMVKAVSNAKVPKFTIIMGNSFGAGNYAMCGKAYDPRFIISMPWAELAVMGGSQAANVLLQIQEMTLKKTGKVLDDNEKNKLLNEIKNKYSNQTKPEYAASRLWTDAIINPLDIRKWLNIGIEISK